MECKGLHHRWVFGETIRVEHPGTTDEVQHTRRRCRMCGKEDVAEMWPNLLRDILSIPASIQKAKARKKR